MNPRRQTHEVRLRGLQPSVSPPLRCTRPAPLRPRPTPSAAWNSIARRSVSAPSQPV